jgi:adenylylsulfate kinase
MAKRILIMGLSGAGKTTLAAQLVESLVRGGNVVSWYNADAFRKQYNDWDFSEEGRLRQATRMRDAADKSTSDYVLTDFIAALEEQRQIYNADYTIWMNTKESCRFEDTNQAFENPYKYDMRITSWDDIDVEAIVNGICAHVIT